MSEGRRGGEGAVGKEYGVHEVLVIDEADLFSDLGGIELGEISHSRVLEDSAAVAVTDRRWNSFRISNADARSLRSTAALLLTSCLDGRIKYLSKRIIGSANEGDQFLDGREERVVILDADVVEVDPRLEEVDNPTLQTYVIRSSHK